jgi:2-phospho-L-lactate/phosphoenolpyruvate guanylyltransferase
VQTVAVLPVKSFGRAKQRLGAALGGPERETLAAAMVGDVLDALSAVDGLDRVVVVTAEPVAAHAAEAAGATVVHDPEEAGQSAAAARGVAAAQADGAERVLLVPGDCPALDPAEVSALLERGGGTRHVTIVPDRHGTGTNALLLAPPTALEPSFGPGSFARHAAHARASGANVDVAAVPSLGLDVDTPGDLAALRAALAARPGGAARTRAALERLAPPPAAAAG